MPNTSIDSCDDSDFVYIDHEIEQAEEATEFTLMTVSATSSPTEGFRLNPTIIENLLLSYLEGPAAKKYTKIDDGFVETEGNYHIRTAYKKIYCDDQPPFFIFQVTRDSKEDDKNKNLPFINHVITAFLNKSPQESAKLLMPMAQCRSHFGKNKQHYVLVEITIDGVNKEIVIHNSQSKWSAIGYLNCLNDLAGFKFKEHNTYGQQKDDFSCGFFVYRYIKSILESENPQVLKDIKASLADPCLNLDEIINDAFSEMNKDFEMRKIMLSENAPWEREELEKVLAENYAKNLGEQLEDFPNEYEDKRAASSSSVAKGANLASTSSDILFFSESLNPPSALETDEIAQKNTR